MYLQFLFEKDDELSPEARFFLIKYLLVFGHAEGVLVGVNGLIKELDINDRGVKRSLEKLICRGYLNVVKLPKIGRGRPKHGVSAGERLLLAIDRWSTSYREILHADLIEALIQEEYADDKEYESQKKLKKSGKLLLAVLYAHADKHGDVEGLGFAELTALTGLNKVQIRALIGMLLSQERVISYIPGVAIKGLKGKFKSTFKLSTSNSGLSSVSANSGTVTFTSVTFAELEQAVLLAHALKAINAGPNEQFKMECELHKDFLLSIYRVTDANYKHVVGSAEFLGGIREINSHRFMRLRLLISNLVAELINSHGVTRSIVELGDAIENSIKPRFGLAPFFSEQASVVRLLSGMVDMLYREVQLHIERDPKSALLKGVTDCSLSFIGRHDVALRYRLGLRSIKLISK